MIHRNTLIATPDLLYLADHRSCQRIDAATGEIKDEIVVPEGISDGPVWKWMALVDDVLYTGRSIRAAILGPCQSRERTMNRGRWSRQPALNPPLEYAPKQSEGFLFGQLGIAGTRGRPSGRAALSRRDATRIR